MSTYEVRQTHMAAKRYGSKTLSVHDSYADALAAFDLEAWSSRQAIFLVKIKHDGTEVVMAMQPAD